MYLGEDSGLNVACLVKENKEMYLRGMLDTGATLSVMSYGAWRRLGYERTELNATEIKIMTANDQPMKILGMTPLVTLRMAGYDLLENFVVVDFLGSDEFILGRSFIRAYGVLIDLNEKVLTVRNPERVVSTREESIQDVSKRVPVYVDETLKVKNKVNVCV